MVKSIYVHPNLFGPPLTLGNLRMGDLIACCNYLEYLRLQNNDPTLNFYIPDESLFPSEHVFKMREWLWNNTDYISRVPEELIRLDVVPGTDETYSSMINLWNIRKDVLDRKQNVFDIEDLVKLPAPKEKKNKIVIAPLMDAPYNADRNWTLEYLQNICFKIRQSWLLNPKMEIIIISKEIIAGLNCIECFQWSNDFETNLQHVLDCKLFVGGDTGFSHFASALDNRPTCEFHYPKSTYGTTNPFYWKTKGYMVYY